MAVLWCVAWGVVSLGPGGAMAAGQQTGRVLFADDFEQGLAGWEIVSAPDIRTVASGEAAHGEVLLLEPNGDDVMALIADSRGWGRVRLEGDVLFPTEQNNYLGLAYNFERHQNRADFGLVYIKGNDSYLQANPHRDLNVGRTLYPEFEVPLRGAAAIRTGEWQRIAMEVVDGVCHVYVGDMTSPQMTFPFFEGRHGRLGLQPRSVGGPVWVDNVRVLAIERLSYSGRARPAAAYDTSTLLTDWQIIGPLTQTNDAIAERPSLDRRWRAFPTDARGAVITARALDYHGPATVGYFRTQVRVPDAGRAVLHVSTVDDIALWVNGRFGGFYVRTDRAWFDFWKTPAHAGRRIAIALRAGPNDIVIRVRGGVYASGGFFARVER